MCLGIPGQVVEVLTEHGGEPTPGDWVLIHMGFALERIDEAEARQALAGLELMGRPRHEE